MKINNKMLEGTGEVVTGLNSEKLAGQSLEYFATRKEVDALNQVITEQAITIGYLMNRQSYSSHYMLDLFINENFTDTTAYTSYSKDLEIMDDNDWNNNWKYTPNGGMEFSQGFLRPPDQPYMLEVIDEYNLEGVGQSLKGNLKYDSVNDCYWMISSAGAGAIGEITKLSTNMKDGKVEVLGRWYIPLVTDAIWSGLAVDGSYLYISYYHTTTSGIGKIAINSDGTLGKLKNANGSTLVLGSTCFEYSLTTITGIINGLINYSETEIGYILCATSTVSIVFLSKTGLGAGTTTSITGLGSYVGASISYYKSADYKDNILYIRMDDDGTDNKRFIYKFNLSSDLTASNVVIKSSGRFENARNVSGNGFGGICFSHDGNLLEVISTASNGKFITKRAIKNALWAENQVCSEKKCNASTPPITPYACMVDPNGNYWTADVNCGTINQVDLYRFDSNGGKHSVRLTGRSLDSVFDLCHDGTNVYLLCRIGTGSNYLFVLKTTLAVLNTAMELVTDYSATNTLDTSTWTSYAISTSTLLIKAITYDSDNDILLLADSGNNRIDSLSCDLTTFTAGVYDLPGATSEWGGIAYKNGNIYVGDYTANTNPGRIFVIPKNKANSTYMWRSHIYQDPSISFASLGRRGLDFDENDLVTIHSNTLRFYKMKVLEDPDVMQLHTFMDAFNILISSTAKASLTLTSCGNVSCCTPIVERYFDPEYFADIRDCPDKNYMAVGYGDEGFSILHLDKFLSGRSSTGKPRYDVRDIRTQHYKLGGTDSANSNVLFSGDFISTIFIEKEMIITGTSANGYVSLIDLKSGTAYTLYDSTSYTGKYAGSLSERNDGKGLSLSSNSELLISNGNIYKIHARTFFKDDASDYNYENPKTFVAIGTGGGCDLLVIDWDENGNRTPVKVWKALDTNTATGQRAVFIAPSGFIFMGYWGNAEGYILWGLDPVWNVVRNNQFNSGDRRGGSTSITVSGYVCDISPNSRCWKTPSGTWRHQLICGSLIWSNVGVCRMYIYDVENLSIEHVFYYAATEYGIWNIDNFEDKIFAVIDHGIVDDVIISQKLKFNDKYTPTLAYNWSTFMNNYTNSKLRPKMLAAPFGVSGLLKTCRYSKTKNMLSVGSSLTGLQMFMFPKQNQTVHKSKVIELGYNPTAVLNKTTTYIEGQK